MSRIGRHHVIGEVEFLTDYGGYQYAQFENALRRLRSKEGKATRIGVLDGVLWIKDSTKMYRTACQLEEVALTAFLLKAFLKSIGSV